MTRKPETVRAHGSPSKQQRNSPCSSTASSCTFRTGYRVADATCFRFAAPFLTACSTFTCSGFIRTSPRVVLPDRHSGVLRYARKAQTRILATGENQKQESHHHSSISPQCKQILAKALLPLRNLIKKCLLVVHILHSLIKENGCQFLPLYTSFLCPFSNSSFLLVICFVFVHWFRNQRHEHR